MTYCCLQVRIYLLYSTIIRSDPIEDIRKLLPNLASDSLAPNTFFKLWLEINKPVIGIIRLFYIELSIILSIKRQYVFITTISMNNFLLITF